MSAHLQGKRGPALTTFRAGVVTTPARPIEIFPGVLKTWSTTHRKPGRASIFTTSQRTPQHRAEDA